MQPPSCLAQDRQDGLSRAGLGINSALGAAVPLQPGSPVLCHSVPAFPTAFLSTPYIALEEASQHVSPCVWGVPLSDFPRQSPRPLCEYQARGHPSLEPRLTRAQGPRTSHSDAALTPVCICSTSPMKSSASAELETKANVFYLVLFSFCYLCIPCYAHAQAW